LRPLLRTAGAAIPWPFRHRRRRNAAQLLRFLGFYPPIPSGLALPQAPAPGGRKGRRHPLLMRSPQKILSDQSGFPNPASKGWEFLPLQHGAPAPGSRSLPGTADGTGGGADLPHVPTVSGQSADWQWRLAPGPPIGKRRSLRCRPFSNRRLYRRTRGLFFDTAANFRSCLAHLRLLPRTADASTSRLSRLHRSRKSAHLSPTIGFYPPILSVLACPQFPAPDEKKGRWHLLRPLNRSPRQ